MPPNDTVSHRCSVIHVVGLECLVHYSMWPYVINVSGSSRTTHKTTLVIPCEVKKRVRKRQYPIFFSFFFSSEGVCLTVCAKICSIHIYVVLADKWINIIKITQIWDFFFIYYLWILLYTIFKSYYTIQLIFNLFLTLSTNCLQFQLRVCLDRTYFAKTENWKHCSKIIFKCVNSTVRPIFNEKVFEKWNLWVRKQCTNAPFMVEKSTFAATVQ